MISDSMLANLDNGKIEYLVDRDAIPDVPVVIDTTVNVISKEKDHSIFEQYDISGEFIQDPKYGFVYPKENYILNITLTDENGEVVSSGGNQIYTTRRGVILPEVIIKSETEEKLVNQVVTTHWGKVIDYQLERTVNKYYSPSGELINFNIE
jgi:hypothetical protein